MTDSQTSNLPASALHIGTQQIGLLEQLCNAAAASGDEGQVRRIVLQAVRPLADEVRVDAMGSVLVTKPGSSGGKRLRVMLAAHMDEAALMLTNDEGDGIFRFDLVGGIDLRQLPGKPVWVGAGCVPGMIGAKPIHLTKADEIKKTITLDTLRIDVGPENGKKVKPGDAVVFATRFAQVGPSLRAKALDDRLGVATLIELLRHAPPNIDLLAAFTVQEEVGLRGAKIAAYALNPDLAVALDCTPANDLPALLGEDGFENNRPENPGFNTRLGAGPAIYIADRRTISDPRLVRYLAQTAEESGIPYQFRQAGGGSTDAAAIQMEQHGIPSISVSVPGRYLHTAISLARVEDWENTLRLLHAALSNLTPEVLASERQ